MSINGIFVVDSMVHGFDTTASNAIWARVAALPWCRGVAIAFCPADRLWDPSRVAVAVR